MSRYRVLAITKTGLIPCNLSPAVLTRSLRGRSSRDLALSRPSVIAITRPRENAISRLLKDPRPANCSVDELGEIVLEGRKARGIVVWWPFHAARFFALLQELVAG